jgi:pimeloyl-ACP methyl ester carboxylesterase
MPPPTRHLLAAAALLGLTTTLTASARWLEPCRIDGLEDEARCGTFEVLEDRDAPEGRRIPLPVVVLPARENALPDPIVFIAGGPGSSSVAMAPGAARAFAAARAERDLLFVDTRGLGGPGALVCEALTGEVSLAGFLADYLPVAGVRACREALAPRFDLARYTTAAAVDDLEEVRRALGYGPVNLYGISYGTRVAQVYLRRYPEAIRTATMVGATPTGDRAPLHFARDAHTALARTFSACAAEPACAAAFPDLDGDLARALARLDAGPLDVELEDAASGATFVLPFTRAGFAQALRYLLYSPVTAALVPLYVHEAATGNFRPAAESVQSFFSGAVRSMADGFYLSVTCSEDVPFIGEEEAKAATAGTFFGDFRIRQQQAACAEWPVRAVDPAHLEPVRSTVPVLIVSGERDPVTPPRAGDDVAHALTNVLHLVVPGGAHGTDGMAGADCPDRIAERFVAAGTLGGLDTSCITAMSSPPFLLALPGADAPAYTPEELARFTGRYAGEGGLETTVLLDGERLRFTLPGREPLALFPVAAARFGIRGLPPGYALEFELDADGAAVALTLVQGADGWRLERRP